MSRKPRILAALLAVGLLAACGQGDAAQTTAAPTDASGDPCANVKGEITVYTVAQEETVTTWVKPFEEKYGVDVLMYRASQEVLSERWAQETRVDQHIADILIVNEPGVLTEADAEGWLAEFTPSNDAAYPSDAKNPGKWYVLYQTAEPMAWNTKEVSAEEAEMLRNDGVSALADKRWKGRIGVVAPQATERVLATYHRWVTDEADEFGWDFVEALADQEPVAYESAVPLVERLVAGEYAVVLGSASSITSRAVASGAPIEFNFPDIATASSFYTAVSANAPNAAAAACFQDWATTPEALAALSGLSEGLPAYEAVPDNRKVVDAAWYAPPKELDTKWQTDEALTKDAPELLDRWADLFGYLK